MTLTVFEKLCTTKKFASIFSTLYPGAGYFELVFLTAGILYGAGVESQISVTRALGHVSPNRETQIGFGKGGLFRKVQASRGSRDFRPSTDSREPPDCGKPRRDLTIFWRF